MRPKANQRGGMYSLLEDMKMKAKLSTLARRLEELEMRNQHEVQAVAEAPVHIQPYSIFQSTDHQGEHCPTTPSVRDLMVSMPMLWANTSHQSMPNATTHIIPIGGTIQTSPGCQTLQHMFPLLHSNSNSVAPHLNHSHHHPHL